MPLNPQKISSGLAGRPQRPAHFVQTVQNAGGETVTLGCPTATRALLALMNSQAVLGGAACHWGGPSAFAEVMSAAHGFLFATKGEEWFEHFNFVNDAGHCENGVYALRANLGFDGMDIDDLKGFRSIESKLTGHGEAHLNPEGVLLSNGPLGSAVAQAQGLALADKLSAKDRVTLLMLSDGASMEGEAREAFASIPGMASKGQLNPFVLVLSDNNTKLSGRIDGDSFSMNPTFDALAVQGWNVIEVPNGNDLQEVYTALEKGLASARANSNQPVCLWLKTVKGIGVKKTAESSSGGHGFPGDAVTGIRAFVQEIYGSEAIPSAMIPWVEEIEAKVAAKAAAPAKAKPAIAIEKIQKGFARATARLVEEGFPILSVTSDLPGSTGIADFRKAHPERSFDVGVAEANMISVGAGLSKQGFIPIVDTFAQFGVTKGSLPITMASLSNSPIIALFSHVGFQDAADGASHQSLGYMASLSYIPGVKVVACSCSADAEAYLYDAAKRIHEARERGESGESVILFLGREDFPAYYASEEKYPWGKAQVLRKGKDGVLIAAGHMVKKALEAADQLAEEGKEVSVIQNAFVNAPDVATVAEVLALGEAKIVTLEDHSILGGMGQMLSHALLENGQQFKIKSLGVPAHFGQSAYLADQLYAAHNMDASAVVKAFNSL